MRPELLLLLAVVVAISWAATGVVRRLALHRDLLDHPNARSSHVVPMPRGGGLAIVLAFAAGLLVVAASRDGMTALAIAVLPAALAVAAVGLWDDHRHVRAAFRLLVHLAAATWMVGVMAFAFALPDVLQGLGGWGLFALGGAAVVATAWCVNLFNFMDGIDGIAATQAVFIGLAGGAVAAWGGDAPLALAFLVLAAANLGFLAWNWPPARIFMGDVGSGFLGLVVAGLLLVGMLNSGRFWPWVVLPAVFVVDASVTLARRILRGDRWYEAHRSHAYQWAARRWGHRAVTLATLGVNLAVVLPAGLAAWHWPTAGLPVTALVYSALGAGALLLGAGRAEAADGPTR